MSQSQLERAVTHLYEDDSIRSDMTDEEAQVLLGWGEARLVEMAAYELPDTQFDEWCGHLHRLLGSINAFIAKRDEMLSGEQARMMRELPAVAQAAHYEVSQPELETFFQQQPTLDNQTAISELLGLFRADAIYLLPTSSSPPAPPEMPNVPPEVRTIAPDTSHPVTISSVEPDTSPPQEQ
jgi:hypothetical protein